MYYVQIENLMKQEQYQQLAAEGAAAATRWKRTRPR